jgi:hypothetical protein
MSYRSRVLVFSFVFVLALTARAEELDAESARTAQVPVLPKVPSRAIIAKQAGADDQKPINEWVQKLIDGKEKRAQTELEAYKKQFIAEERRRQMEERDRERRQERLEIGGAPIKREANAPIHIKMEFQVPEITAYRAIADTLRAHQEISNAVAQTLAKLDRDGDGKLSAEEYREAGAILASTLRIFQPLDSNADGLITEAEIDAAREVPRNIPDAIKAGKAAVDASNFRIKTYDANGDGVLDVDERKALVMAYVDASLRAGQDAAFYNKVADTLTTSREMVAAKFADVEITP